jgi:hypothetical protein
MADTRTTADQLRPREIEAGELYEAMPESERSYEKVGELMKVTGPRAAVYVRDYLRLSGKEHLLPQRGRRGNGGNAASIVEEDANPIHDLERFLATVDERITALATQRDEVVKAADEFDAEAAVTQEAERLAKIVSDAQAAHDAFVGNDDAQTNWANREQGNLVTRKTEVIKTTEQRLTKLAQKKDGLEKVIELANSNPELAAMFASSATDEDIEGDNDASNDGEPLSEAEQAELDAASEGA